MSHVWYDRIIESGILFLLVFTPLAMGAVHDWSRAVMELVSFGIFIAWALKSLRQGEETGGQDARAAGTPLRKMAVMAGLLGCVALLQLVPLSPSLLSAVSPGTSALYQNLLNRQGGALTPISLHPHATIGELIRFCSCAALFIVVVGHYRTEEQIKALFRAVIAMGVFLALLGVLQKLFGNGNLLWVITPGPGWSYFGPYINRNHFAGYMEMAAPIALGYYLYSASLIKGERDGASRVKQLLSFLDNRRLPVVSASLAAVLIMSGALFMSMSRGGITGFMLSLLVFMLLARSRKSLRKRKIFLAVAGGLIAFAIVVAGWSMLEARFEKSATEGTTRLATWQNSLALIRDYPLLGTGFGAFGRAYPAYQTGYPHLYFDHPENEYLELVADSGLIGLVAAVGLAAIYLSSVLRRWRERHNSFVVSMAAAGIASCSAIMVHGLVDFNMRIPANTLLLTVIAAATFAAVFNIESKRQW